MGIEYIAMAKVKNIYVIKDIARLSGHSIHTVNYYLNLGLLKEFGRSPETNIRFFDDRSVERLHEIRRMRTEGMPIREIRKKLGGRK